MIFFYILISARNRRKINFVNESPFAIFALNSVILLLIFQTGGLTSPLFFLLYFILFGIAFVFEANLVFVFAAGVIATFITQVFVGDTIINLLKVGSFIILSPMAYLVGTQTKFGAKSYNLLVLGVIGNYLGFDKTELWENVFEKLKSKFKSKEIEEKNKLALEFGAKIVLEKGEYSKAEFKADLGDKLYRNKEREGIIKPSLCKGCLICVEKCPVGALSKGSEVGFFGANIPDLNIEKCITCGICKRFCPDGAVAVEKR